MTDRIIAFSDVGPGGTVSSPLPLQCRISRQIQNSGSDVEWQRPDRSGININPFYPVQAVGEDCFATIPRDSQMRLQDIIELKIGPNYNSPAGNYCCATSTSSKCVTLSK